MLDKLCLPSSRMSFNICPHQNSVTLWVSSLLYFHHSIIPHEDVNKAFPQSWATHSLDKIEDKEVKTVA